ncbi:MAG: hypothetical protein HQ568_02785 [Calditrichaeota bacterium]|nr:hypothetical protein [Calditrichota bacterium]
MKTLLTLIIFLLIVVSNSVAGELIDIIHLKNGDIVKGEIIKDIPGEHLKIKLQDGQVLGYLYSEIKQIYRGVLTGKDPELERRLAEEERLRKETQYKYGEKNPRSAALLACFIPSAGHYYAGNWTRGLLFAIGRVGSIAYVIKESDNDYNYFKDDRDLPDEIYIGFGFVALFTIIEVIDANWEAKIYNDRLYEEIFGSPKLSLRPAPARDGVCLTLTYRF